MSSERCSYRTRGYGLETSPKATRFWKSGSKFAFGRNKGGKVFGILSLLKKMSKLMMCMHKTKRFLAVRNEQLLPLKICVTEGGDITFIHYWVEPLRVLYMFL